MSDKSATTLFLNIRIFGVSFETVDDLVDSDKHLAAELEVYNNYLDRMVVSEALSKLQKQYPKYFSSSEDMKRIKSCIDGDEYIESIYSVINSSLTTFYNTHKFDNNYQISKKRKKSSDILGGLTDEELQSADSNLFERAIKNTLDSLESYKKTGDANTFINKQGEVKKQANNVLKNKINAAAAKVTSITDTVNANLAGFSENRREQLKRLLIKINDIPNAEELQKFVWDYLMAEKGDTVYVKNKPVEVKFSLYEKIAQDKAKPILEKIKPWYDMVMEIYSMDISLDTVVDIATQLALIQFAPLIEKYEQYSATINDYSCLVNEIGLIRTALEEKAAGLGVPLDITTPNIPTLPSIPQLPLKLS